MIGHLIGLVIVVLVAGVLIWAIDRMPVIDADFKTVARIILIAAVVIYAIILLAGLFGFTPAWR